MTKKDDINSQNPEAKKATRRNKAQLYLFAFMEKYIAGLTADSKIRTGEIYAATLRSLQKYTQGTDIKLSKIDCEFVNGYESWLKSTGCTANTSSFYIARLRATYNAAIEQGLATGNSHDIFKKVFTGQERKIRQGLSATTIKKIKSVDLTDKPKLDYVRDLFMISFYLRGMTLADMANLQAQNLKNGLLTYQKSLAAGRTSRQTSIKWTNEIQEIVAKYPKNGEYLFPIIDAEQTKNQDATEIRREFQNKALKINRQLLNLGVYLNIPIKLTMNVSKYSWAIVAHSAGVPTSTIGAGLGFFKEEQTNEFMSSLSAADVTDADEIILNSLE